jgi:hypothetical protein
MTELSCSAVNCFYNKDHLCSKGDIMVEGKGATSEGDTFCSSFREKGCGCTNSSSEHASRMIDVDCEAEKCTYNEDCKCHAMKIGIGGAGATQCHQTECATFKCK